MGYFVHVWLWPRPPGRLPSVSASRQGGVQVERTDKHPPDRVDANVHRISHLRAGGGEGHASGNATARARSTPCHPSAGSGPKRNALRSNANIQSAASGR